MSTNEKKENIFIGKVCRFRKIPFFSCIGGPYHSYSQPSPVFFVFIYGISGCFQTHS
jgi:hypothetical protein